MAQLAPDERKHQLRVERELRTAGVSNLGMKRLGHRDLYRIVHPDERIQAVAYGRYRDTKKLPAWNEGILLATDRRVLFLDRKPSFIKLEDIPYDKIAGVESTKAGPSGSVTLFAGANVHALLFVPNRCRQQFVAYLEQRQLEKKQE